MGLRAVQVLAFTTVRVRSATGMSLLALLPAAARITTTASCVTVDSPAQEQVVTTADSAALPTTLALLLAGPIRVRWVVMGLRAVQVLAFTTVRVRSATGMSLRAAVLAFTTVRVHSATG